MSDKKLAILGIVAVMMVGFAFLQNRIRHTVGSPDFSRAPLIEGLQIEAVAAITITSDRGEQAVTLNRMASGFVVTDKDNYPADVAAINTLLNQCLDIYTLEAITDNPDNHADLKVTSQTAHSVVSFLDSARSEIVAVVVSPSDEQGGASFAVASLDVCDRRLWLHQGILHTLSSNAGDCAVPPAR